MALSRFLVVLLGVLLTSCADASEVGVNYGRVANNLPDPASVVRLLKDNGITRVKIFDANPEVLGSLANTGIKVMVMVPNENVAAAASDPSYALQWVKSNVAAYYPATQIHGVAVGNEVFDSQPELNSQLVSAMENVQRALAQLGLADAVKVSTPVAFSAVTDSFPPSSGRFRDEIAEPVMRPMLEFLKRTGSYLTMNMYPFWAYFDDPQDISLDYALGNAYQPGVLDRDTGLKYLNLLDAQRDAAHSAMDALVPGVGLHVTETGHPSGGRPSHDRRRLQDGDDVFTVANAQAYTSNLISRVQSGKTGTPLRPDADMDVYIFALFNENIKGQGPDDVEQHFGLFYPNMTKVYEFDLDGGRRPLPTKFSWCVAFANVGDQRLQEALDWACANGANCSAIQRGASCFQPDTLLAHATYAFNSYYQRKGKASGTCDFSGAAYVVYTPPYMCRARTSWCVANETVGDERLQGALDWACGNGADCSDIQPSASCYQPNTKAAHASHAFNSYYQRNYRARGTCHFSGAASVVYQEPRLGDCVLPSRASTEDTIVQLE